MKQVHEVRYNAHLQYLLVVLDSAVKREELEALQPDMPALKAAYTGEGVMGVCISCRGNLYALPDMRMPP